MRRRILASLAKSGYTAKDYVQDGLVAMWDGIENAGWGVHDPNATVWKNLVGVSVPDVSLIGTPSWGNDRFEFDGSQYFSGSGSSLYDVILSAEYTVEFLGVCPVGQGNGNGGLISIGAIGQRQFWLWERNSSINDWFDSCQTMQGNWNVQYLIQKGNPALLQFSVSEENQSGMMFLNGVLKQSKTSISTTSISGDGFYLGKLGLFNNCKSNMMAVRIYNKQLTSEQLSTNYAVDKARFGLP